MSKGVPPPPDLREAIRKHYRTPLTVAEQATVEFEAYLRANGGKLRPLTEKDLGVPPSPDFTAAIKAEVARQEAQKAAKEKQK